MSTSKEKQRPKSKNKRYTKELVLHSVQSNIENIDSNNLDSKCITTVNANSNTNAYLFSNESHKRTSTGLKRSSSKQQKDSINDSLKKKKNLSFFNKVGSTNLNTYNNLSLNMNCNKNTVISNIISNKFKISNLKSQNLNYSSNILKNIK